MSLRLIPEVVLHTNPEVSRVYVEPPFFNTISRPNTRRSLYEGDFSRNGLARSPGYTLLTDATHLFVE